MKKLFLLFTLIASFALMASAGDKTNYRNALVLAYSPANNVYEDDNIRLEIYDGKLWAQNKTDRTIFIDLSQCFLNHNGASYPMLSGSQNEKQASKNGISSKDDLFITIAPLTGNKQNDTFICSIDGGLYRVYSTAEATNQSFTEYEERMFTLINDMLNESLAADPKGKQYLGTSYRHLTEDESINNIGANVAYAFNKRAENWTPIAISTWVSDVYFTPYYVEMPETIDKKDKKGFDLKRQEAAKIHLKASSPFEFDADRSPIIVTDWSGNLNKGEFYINPTRVAKRKGLSFGRALFGGLATLATGGLAAGLLVNSAADIYKLEVIFDGQDKEWPNMKYFTKFDLSKFNNKHLQ